MSGIHLYDDRIARGFEPFALTRPAGELRAGALLVRERWSRALGHAAAAHLTSPHLVGFTEAGAPAALSSGSIADGTLSLSALASSARSTGELAGWFMHAVWDYVGQLAPMLVADIPALGAGMSQALPDGVLRVGAHPVYLEEGAVVEPMTCLDTTDGPILLRAGSHVLAFTRLVGPLYVGLDSILMGDRIAASSIGDVCKVHGELSNTIFLGYANKGHDGFVGHSMLGRWVNLGAGTITSNLKNTYGTVQCWTPGGIRETGLQFLGTLFGDHAKTGIGLRLTTGSVLGAAANVYGTAMPPKAVDPFAWGEAGGFVVFRSDKFLEVAERMMARRRVPLTEASRAQLLASYDARWAAGL
jgi:UDP-N-acetylglucosamine diphosphorylase/glucosamine-1-phosphate N-acetyltransferase